MANISNIEFTELLERVQQFLSERYAEALSNPAKYDQIRPVVLQYIRENGFIVEGLETTRIVDELYSELVEYSFLTPYLDPSRTDIEEINVNAWDNVVITYTDGRMEQIRHFYSPRHAQDIIKKLVRDSQITLNDTTPLVQGNLPGNIRVTAMISPLMDEVCAASTSIRILHPGRISREVLVKNGTITNKMMDFLSMLLNFGCSFVISGATSSGKTTLLNALLATIPDNKRVFTIESGARELSLVRKDENGVTRNNVIHTLTRPSSNPIANIEQEDLVIASLRYDPDVVVVGEMRDREAAAAVEAALTGHTVVSTIHSFEAAAAHTRLAMLCQKADTNIKFDLTMMQVAEAFPVVIFAHRLENNDRRVMNISECLMDEDGRRRYRTLYQYVVDRNYVVDGAYQVEGHFEKVNDISESMERRLIRYGIPYEILQKFKTPGPEYGA